MCVCVCGSSRASGAEVKNVRHYGTHDLKIKKYERQAVRFFELSVIAQKFFFFFLLNQFHSDLEREGWTVSVSNPCTNSGFFSVLKRPDGALGLTQPSIQWLQALFHGGKTTGS